MADQSFNTTQYISLKKPLSGSFQNIWDVPLNENWDTIAALFSSAAEVGHTHSGAEGQGPQVDHTALLSIGTYTHAELDTHVDNTALHANTAIGTISGDHANSPVITTVTDVTHIKFTNATVTDLGSGVIQVSRPPLLGSTTSTGHTGRPSKACAGSPSSPLTRTRRLLLSARPQAARVPWRVSRSMALYRRRAIR
jgi:hypothetical protein